jgi:hypothetical protein
LTGSMYVYSIWAPYEKIAHRYAMTHVQVIYAGCKEYIGSDEAVYILHKGV